MTTPLFARKSLDNTVGVVDGEFETDGKFALRTTDKQALTALLALQTQGAENGKEYSYAFNWTSGKLTTIVRTHGGNSETLTFTYHGTGELAGISQWV